MFQKAKEKGCAELTFLSAATSSASSIQQDALSATPSIPNVVIATPPATAQPITRTVRDAVVETTSEPWAKKTPVIILRKQSQVSQRCRHFTPVRMQHWQKAQPWTLP